MSNAVAIEKVDPAQRTGAQFIWEVLAREGVDVVFGYPGGAIMPTYDAMPAYPVRHVLVRHEQGAAHMADGYARASGRVGVALATSGLANRRAAALSDAAARPLMLAGHGVLKSQSSKLLREFAEKTGIPVASTLLGLGGFPASHPLSLGMMGMHGEAFVNTALQEADLLLAFGMRFDDRVTGKLQTFAVHARKIHAEIDPSEINT